MAESQTAEKTKKKYKIIYDREGCIGAAACVAVYGRQWTLDDEGKAKYAIEEFDDDELMENVAAAKSCPVSVISIINQETGEKVV